MPELTRFDVTVEVRTIVREHATGRRLLDVTTSGTSTGDTGDGLTKGTAPALAEALAHHAPMVESYRKHDTNAALAERHGR